MSDGKVGYNGWKPTCTLLQADGRWGRKQLVREISQFGRAMGAMDA